MILNGHDQYPSRRTEEVVLIDRHHDVVHGTADDGHLTAEQLEEFTERGFLSLDGLFSADDLAHLVEEVDGLTARDDVRDDDACLLDGDSVQTLFDVARFSPAVDALLRDDRLAGAARQLLGDDVTLLHNRINHSPGRVGTAAEWHADFEAFHVEDGMPTPRAVGVAVTLIDRPSDIDPMLLIPGSHWTYVTCLADTVEDPDPGHPRSLPDTTSLGILADRHGIESWGAGAGAVILFDVNLMLARNGGVTPAPRSHLFAVYNAADNALEAPFGTGEPRPEWVTSRSTAPLTPQMGMQTS